MVSLKVHNILDYVLGVVLLACPFVFGFSDVDAARSLFVVLGFGIIAYSLITDYPISIFKWVPLGWHMALDVLLGVSLVLGAYIFGYNDLLSAGQMALHYVLGIGAIVLVATTQPKANQPSVVQPSTDADIDRRAA
jgi:hypothetical protein